MHTRVHPQCFCSVKYKNWNQPNDRTPAKFTVLLKLEKPYSISFPLAERTGSRILSASYACFGRGLLALLYNQVMNGMQGTAA